MQLGLLERFVAFCRAGATETQIRRWLTKHPKIAEISTVPKDMKNFRAKFDAQASHGGKRKSPERMFYVVKDGRAL